MPQTLTFAKVFTAEGEKNGKTWKRWDFKTAEGERYVTFNAGLANRISVNTPVTVEIEGDNKIAALVGSAPLPAAEPQQAAQTAPAASEKPDWDAIARGKVKSLLWAALLPAMFSSITPKTDQTPEAAQQLVDYAMGEIFPGDVPF